VIFLIKAVLFDFDMTLVDSSYAITEALNTIAEGEGLRTLSREEVLSVIGLPMDVSWVKLWGRYEPEWVDNYRMTFREREYAHIKVFPNTVSLLDQLMARGIPMGVASNRTKVSDAVKAVGFDKYFNCTLGILDVEKAKPEPDMILKGLDILQVAPEDAIYVGDTEADMASAKAANVKGVGMTTGNCDHNTLTSAGAWKTFEDLRDILTLF
jgi:HAD superfamily hydrolase (TIGR01509 family)